MTGPVIVWFRQDLRLHDNPALTVAADAGAPLLPIYVHDTDSAGAWAPGAASRWWLHQSLASLSADLAGKLCFFEGDAAEVVPAIAEEVGASAVYVNDGFEPWRIESDRKIAAALGDLGIDFERHRAVTLFDPDGVLKDDGTPYKVFTPFYKKACSVSADSLREPLPAPDRIKWLDYDGGVELDALELTPAIPWYESIADEWQPGEAGAHDRLETFVENGIDGYREGRNRPDQQHVSRLSPHLHHGEISPNQVWHAVKPLERKSKLAKDVETFLSELGWREFSYYLLKHFPELPEENLQSKFDRFPWCDDDALLERWQRGETGYPIVDAGMRELWATGYMHNRIRMIVASFLVKNLMIDWRHGERWFWDTLVDADLANNSASWQWVAGSGADAAPYFRIFNPITQGKKFDPNGDYVRRHVPELAELGDDCIHEPWRAEESERKRLDYPDPVVDLKTSRERALEAFKGLSD